MGITLYDADANQSVTLASMIGGAVYELGFEFSPLADDQAVSFIDDREADSAKLFPKLLVGVKGLEGEEPVEDATEHLQELAELIPDDDKRFVVDGALMGARILPPPKANKKLNLRQLPETALHQLAAYFDGAEVITKHEMIPGTAQHSKVFDALEARQFPVKFGDYEIKSYGAGLVKLYDALQCRADGYKGRVPAHHKMLVVATHLRGQRQIVMGK